jgi:SAM-dependent methyltransferase
MDRRSRALQHHQPYIQRARSFSGWNLDDVDVRPFEPGPPWDYEAIARAHARRARTLLDLGTGLPARVIATELWEVSAPVAQRRLAPLGTHVVRCSSLQLPFRDASFDLVLDRHEELDPAEVARVLRSGGWLVTQQVGYDDWAELWPFFPSLRNFGDHFRGYTDGLRAAGMAVTATKHYRKVAFRTLGDVVYMLLLSPWWFPAFDPEREIDTLLALEDALRTDDGIVLTESRYLVTAEKGS